MPPTETQLVLVRKLPPQVRGRTLDHFVKGDGNEAFPADAGMTLDGRLSAVVIMKYPVGAGTTWHHSKMACLDGIIPHRSGDGPKYTVWEGTANRLPPQVRDVTLQE